MSGAEWIPMMAISLTKTINPGSFRWIGQQVQGISTLDIPIGVVSAECALKHTGGTLYRVGRIRPANAFVIEREPLRLLYVRKNYKGYRRAAQHIYTDCGWAVDYDHALGSKIAGQLEYEFTLLIRLTPLANRSHGVYEKNAKPSLVRKDCCFADRRIVDKWLGRPPHRIRTGQAISEYTNSVEEEFGLTLKQAGVWGFAMGVEDRFRHKTGLQPLILN